jgi:hypothetical protein
MPTRLKNWIQGSRRKSGERWEADRDHLSEQERHYVDAQERLDHGTRLDVQDAEHGPKVFDETRRR